MDRDIERDDHTQGERVHAERRPEPREGLDRADLSRERDAIPGRYCTFRLSEAERETMFDTGRFRTVAVADLLRVRYAGKTEEMNEDLRSLTAQGLVQRRTAWVGGRQQNLDVLVLT